MKGTENSKSVISKLPTGRKRRAKKITKSHVSNPESGLLDVQYWCVELKTKQQINT